MRHTKIAVTNCTTEDIERFELGECSIGFDVTDTESVSLCLTTTINESSKTELRTLAQLLNHPRVQTLIGCTVNKDTTPMSTTPARAYRRPDGLFSPPAPLPAPCPLMTGAVFPSKGLSNGNAGQLGCVPQLTLDPAGQLWAGLPGGIETPYSAESGAYYGPRPVLSVTHVPTPSGGLVVVATDEAIYLLTAEEWASQV